MERVRCIILRNRRILSYHSAKDLLEMGLDELFVIDMDALDHGSYNFKLYYDLSKFFEITVMNFPRRTADVVDSIISGASRLVISSTMKEKSVIDYLTITEDLVMNYGDMKGCRTFSEHGGRYYLSNRIVDLPFKRVFIYGQEVDREGYVFIEGFPQSLPNEANAGEKW